MRSARCVGPRVWGSTLAGCVSHMLGLQPLNTVGCQPVQKIRQITFRKPVSRPTARAAINLSRVGFAGPAQRPATTIRRAERPSVYTPHGTIHRSQNLTNKPARTVELLIVEKGKPRRQDLPSVANLNNVRVGSPTSRKLLEEQALRLWAAAHQERRDAMYARGRRVG